MKNFIVVRLLTPGLFTFQKWKSSATWYHRVYKILISYNWNHIIETHIIVVLVAGEPTSSFWNKEKYLKLKQRKFAWKIYRETQHGRGQNNQKNTYLAFFHQIQTGSSVLTNYTGPRGKILKIGILYLNCGDLTAINKSRILSFLYSLMLNI